MPNYNDTPVEGVEFRRCRGIFVNNIINQIPTAEFIEQDIVVADEKVLSAEAGSILESITPENIGTEFPIVDPTTLEPIPGQTATYGQVLGLMRSAYVYMAKKRDAAQS